MTRRKERPHLYVLDGHEPRGVWDVIAWAQWFEQRENRLVMRTKLIDGSVISTVFLGIDHSFIGNGPPILFESALCPSDGPIEVVDRYATWAEAEAGHMSWIERCVPPELIELTTKENVNDFDA